MGRKYQFYTVVLSRKKLPFSARSRTTMIAVREPKMESHVFLVSSHDAATLNVFQHSGGKCYRICRILRCNEAK